MRRWQIPTLVREYAQSSPARENSALVQDLANGLPIGQTSLEAIVASVESPALKEWAADLLNKAQLAEETRITNVLVASGFDELGCSPSAYGLLDPSYEPGERIVAVVRAAADPDTWERITASGWEACVEPTEMPFINLRGDTLADALETLAAGASLLLYPVEPQAWLSAKVDPQVITAASALGVTDPTTAAGGGSVYAIVDPLNTSAVVSLFQVLPGPKISVRNGDAWAPDDGTLLAQLTGLNPPPVVSVPTEQVPDVVRQVDDFDASHPQTAAGPNGAQAPQATQSAIPAGSSTPPSGSQSPPNPGTAAVTASARPDGLKAAGLAVLAQDTGRAFMLQRGIDEADDPAKGKLEYPGGMLEGDETPYEGAKREWQEETGHPLPPAINNPESTEDSWNSTNGVYRGHVHVIKHENEINLADRKTGTNPDDPDGDSFEAAVWMDPKHLAGNPMVRDELQHSMPQVHSAMDGWLPSDSEEPLQPAKEPNDGLKTIQASIHHDRRIREARDADAAFDADRAASDMSEQQKRRSFEAGVGSRYNTLKTEGISESDAASTVRREVEAEDLRRKQWEKQRADSLLGEKERRLRAQPELRLSKDLTGQFANTDGPTPVPMGPVAKVVPAAPAQAMAAAAVPHTLLPPALFNYWVHGKGALKIRWNTAHDFYRCRDHLVKYVHDPHQVNGLCAELHKFATGRWTGSRANKLIEGGKA